MGEQPIINRNGLQTRDYVFVEDVVKANLIALKEVQSDVYNVGTSKETTVNEIFNLLNGIIGKGKEEKHGPAAAGEQMRSVITSDKIFKDRGWKPSTKLEDGLKKTVEYFKERK